MQFHLAVEVNPRKVILYLIASSLDYIVSLLSEVSEIFGVVRGIATLLNQH
jgi:hypothetical protein